MKNNKLAFAVSLFILIALPLISLYYSFQGRALRRQAMSELLPKGNLSSGLKQYLDTSNQYFLFASTCEDTLVYSALINQFESEEVQYYMMNDSAFFEKYSISKAAKWKKEGKVKVLTVPSNEILDSACQVALVNRSGQILNRYSMENPEQRKRLIEHVALLVTKK